MGTREATISWDFKPLVETSDGKLTSMKKNNNTKKDHFKIYTSVTNDNCRLEVLTVAS